MNFAGNMEIYFLPSFCGCVFFPLAPTFFFNEDKVVVLLQEKGERLEYTCIHIYILGEDGIDGFT